MLSRGFTLLELIVVLFIIGILLTLIVPSLSDGRSRRLNEMRDQMVMLINQARQEAVLSSRIWKVEFDSETDSYSFTQRNGSGFDKSVDGPFSSARSTPSVEFQELLINGEPAAPAGAVYLFPTGEQDTFRLVLRAGEHVGVVAMGPVGPAEGGTQ